MDNAEKVSEEVHIQLGDELVCLRANFGTLLRYKKKTGRNPLAGVPIDPEDLTAFVWAAIGGDACGKTVEQVAELLSLKSLAEIGRAVKQAIRNGEPPEEPGKNAEAPASESATGGEEEK